MYDSVSLQIIAFFLIIVDLQLVSYLYRRLGCSSRWIPIRPLYALLASISVLLFSIYFSSNVGADFYLLGFAIGSGIVLSLVSPVAALGFFSAALLLRPWEIDPLAPLLSALPKTLAGLTLFSWVFHSLRRKQLGIRWNFACTVLLLFVLWLMVSALFSGSSAESLQYLSERFIPIVVVSLLIINCLSDPLDIRALQNVLMTSVAGVIGTAICYTLRDPLKDLNISRLKGIGLLGNANDLAALAALALPFVIFLCFIRGKGIAFRFYGLFMFAIIAGGLWIAQSRGALLAVLVSGGVYLLLCTRSVKSGAIIAAATLAVPLALFLSIERSSEDLSISGTSRLNYAIAGIRMAKAFPVFGVGVGNYPRYYESFTPSFEEWGERTAHSSWVLVLAEAGPLGLLLFATLFAAAFIPAWKMRKQYPEFLLALIGYGVAISFLSHSYLFTPYVLITMIIAAWRVHSSPVKVSV